jgi:hypothetical protein
MIWTDVHHFIAWDSLFKIICQNLDNKLNKVKNIKYKMHVQIVFFRGGRRVGRRLIRSVNRLLSECSR